MRCKYRGSINIKRKRLKIGLYMMKNVFIFLDIEFLPASNNVYIPVSTYMYILFIDITFILFNKAVITNLHGE